MPAPIADTTAPAPVTEPAPTSNVGVLTHEQRAAWNKGEESTETVPDKTSEVEPKSEEAAPSPSDIAPGSEPGTSTQDKDKTGKQKTPQDSEKRWKELSEEKGNLQRRVEELERQLSAPRDNKQPSQPAAEVKPEPKVAATPKPKLDDLDPVTGKPKYASVEDWADAREDWNEKRILSEIDGRQSRVQQETKVAESRKVLLDKFQERTVEVRKTLPDFDEVALKTPLPIREGSVADAFLMESAHGPEMLYALAKDVPAIERIQKLNPIAQARELVYMELLHGGLEELKKDPRFSELLTPAIPVTRVPRPPTELGGRGTTPNDALESAAKAKDYRAYAAEATRRALAEQ